MQALVIGGTGPTGPFIVRGLLDRGYEVTVLNRGLHDNPELPASVPRLQADPHFRETLETALAGRTFDLVVATYGRLRLVADVVVGKTARLIGVGGIPVYRGLLIPQRNFPTGMRLPTAETEPRAASDDDGRFAHLMAQTEDAVMQHHYAGHYHVTWLRYPLVYGPYQVAPTEWCVIRRILDQRPYILVPDGGLTIVSRGYAANVARAVLLAVDYPEKAAGQMYNCGDEHWLTLYQWVEIITRTLEYAWEIIALPDALAHPARPLIPLRCSAQHQLLDLTKLKQELGYRDVLPVEAALAETVRWYLAHPPERGGALEQKLQDPFDYAAEDHLVRVWKDSLERLAAVPFAVESAVHPYAHPKTPGQLDHRQR